MATATRPTTATLGLGVPYWRGWDARHAVALAASAAESGITSLWAGDVAGPDPFGVLAACSAQPFQRLGIGVAQVGVRSPANAAIAAATLANLAGQEVCLGLGVSSKPIIEGWHGLTYDRPLQRLTEYLQVVKQALAGETTTYAGDYFRSHGLRLRGEARVRLYVGALSGGSIRLAAEQADGVVLANITPDALRSKRALLDDASPARREVIVLVRGLITDSDGEAALQWLRRHLTPYIAVPAYGRIFAEMGYEESVERVQRLLVEGEAEQAREAVEIAMVREVAAVGPAADVHARLKEYADAGADEVVLVPLAVGDDAAVVAADSARVACEAWRS